MKGQALLPADGMMATAKSELNSGLRHVPVGSKERIHLDLNVSNATRCRRLMCAEVELRRCDLVAHRCTSLLSCKANTHVWADQHSDFVLIAEGRAVTPNSNSSPSNVAQAAGKTCKPSAIRPGHQNVGVGHVKTTCHSPRNWLN